MEGYTDIHTHILPGIDDGADTFEESVQMLKQEYEQGVRGIFCTPHYIGEEDSLTIDERRKVFGKFKKMSAEIYPNIELYLGNEVYYTNSVPKALKSGEILTMAETKYVLVEFNTEVDYKTLYGGLRSIIEAGYKPILGHAERYECLYKNKEHVEDLVKMRTYIQINCRSFLGGILDREAAWCTKIFAAGLVHFIASDCHNPNGRAPIMEKTIAKLKKKVDPELVKKVTEENILKLLNDAYL